jgi:hypothetical protein
MFRRAVLIFAVLFFLLPIISAGETFELLNVDFPSIRPGTWQPDKSSLPYAKYPVKLRLHFYLTEQGKVDSINYYPGDKKGYFDRIEPSLNKIAFYPALYNRKPIPFIFPVDIEFYTEGGKSKIKIDLPYDNYTCIKRKNILDTALVLNGFAIPGLIRFPSYFCYFADPSLTDNYPYAIFEIELDSAGQLIDYNQTFSSYEAYSRLIMNAIMYADFQPEKYKNAALPSKFYLVVRFFENLNYPTTLWPPPKDDPRAKMPFDYIRLETGLYLDSVINPPIPTNAPFNVYRIDKLTQIFDTAYVKVKIDTLGHVKKYTYAAYIVEPLQKIVDEVVPKLKFTAASDLSGKNVNFEGGLSLIFDSSKKIRIIAEWLPLEAQTGWR